MSVNSNFWIIMNRIFNHLLRIDNKITKLLRKFPLRLKTRSYR